MDFSGNRIQFCLICTLTIGLFVVPAHTGIVSDLTENTANAVMDRLGIRRTMFDINEAGNGRLLVTDLDNFRGVFVLLRHIMLGLTNMDDLSRRNRDRGKMQQVVPRNVSFPCNVTNGRSVEAPASVHRLRPGDIDVVASLGDSLSAGNGIISESLGDILNEVRGITFSGGGLGIWRQYLTLPNILKVFNPHLYGYSIGNGLTVDQNSRLNMAEPMVMSRDLPYQVRTLIERMRHDPRIDMERHWKLLTIFVGNNDICSDMCHHENIDGFLQRHETDLRQALGILRDNVPRMVVNILSPPNIVTTLSPMREKPMVCSAVHLIGCHCIFSERIGPARLKIVSETIERWQEIDERVSYSPEFQTEDFAVIYHPFITNITTPTLPNGSIDFRYFASDCFHFSQLGQASVANSLWNSMLQPIGQQQEAVRAPFRFFECPTEQRPYIATLQNSRQAEF